MRVCFGSCVCPEPELATAGRGGPLPVDGRETPLVPTKPLIKRFSNCSKIEKHCRPLRGCSPRGAMVRLRDVTDDLARRRSKAIASALAVNPKRTSAPGTDAYGYRRRRPKGHRGDGGRASRLWRRCRAGLPPSRPSQRPDPKLSSCTSTGEGPA